MNTDKPVTIDDSTLTTITGGGQSPWQKCLAGGVIGAVAGGATGGPAGAAIWGAAGCASGLTGYIPAHDSAPKSTYNRPGMPNATESRL
jgi:hypothetical protein